MAEIYASPFLENVDFWIDIMMMIESVKNTNKKKRNTQRQTPKEFE